MLLCAGIAGAQTGMETMRFGITIQYEASFKGIPVHARLIPLKSPGSLAYPLDLKGEERKVFVVYNLDMWGAGKPERVALGSGGFAPKVTVSITWTEDGKPRFPHISYYIPYLARWVSHADVASARSPVHDMEVSPIEFDAKENRFWFSVTKWPTDDRMMCHGD